MREMSEKRPADWFELSGGALCLDFANTISRRPTGAPLERLETYRDAAEWARLAELPAAARLRASDDAADTKRLAELKRCREILYRLFSDAAAERSIQRPLQAFTREWRRLLPHTTLVHDGSAVRCRYDGPPESMDAILWPVMWSAATLLSSDELPLVRECAARDCGWLFVDRSRGRRRRWCDMRICGNREKLRRFRAS